MWRGIAFALTPIVLGVFGFIGVWIGAVLAVPLLVRAVRETRKVRTLTDRRSERACAALASFVLFVIAVLGWD